MIASEAADTDAGRPHSATSPGRWVTRKAMWKPQVKEAGVQAQVASVLERDQRLLGQADAAECAPSGRPGALSRSGSASGMVSRRRGGQAQHRGDPAEGADQRLRQRREHELAEGAAGVDEARGERAAFRRQALRRGADEYGETAGARSCRGDDAEEENQAETGSHERRHRQAQRQAALRRRR